MNIKETFLSLTSKTYPYGTESDVEAFLPEGFFKDKKGNCYIKIGESKTAFTCHMDTACKTQDRVVHKFDGKYIQTDGCTILGADDKAGMTILLYMIKNKIPGLYCFFIGEEVGCIGSTFASDDDMFLKYDRMISFDRRSTGSVITFQSSRRCCSDKFADALASQLNKLGMSYKKDDTGVYTDSAEFTAVIPECTNLSVGYYSEHTTSERQDIEHLENLANACLKVDWESLPVERDKTKTERKTYTYSGGFKWSFDNDYGLSKRDKKRIRRSKKVRTTTKYWWSQEEEFEEVDYDFSKENEDITSFQEVKNHYEPFKQYLYDDRLTKEEFDKISGQLYLDPSEEEKRFLEFFSGNIL
ncbi:hypothetical protein EBU94_03065 [bacterium]|nr:hypothetical protein [bacterium]